MVINVDRRLLNLDVESALGTHRIHNVRLEPLRTTISNPIQCHLSVSSPVDFTHNALFDKFLDALSVERRCQMD